MNCVDLVPGRDSGEEGSSWRLLCTVHSKHLVQVSRTEKRGALQLAAHFSKHGSGHLHLFQHIHAALWTAVVAAAGAVGPRIEQHGVLSAALVSQRQRVRPARQHGSGHPCVCWKQILLTKNSFWPASPVNSTAVSIHTVSVQRESDRSWSRLCEAKTAQCKLCICRTWLQSLQESQLCTV